MTQRPSSVPAASVDAIPWEELSSSAWRARQHARVYGPTRVGAAVLADSGAIYVGCNVEHRFRSHDVHAEVSALARMISSGDGQARAVLVAADRERFTPCGSCLDWVFELGGPDCFVAFQSAPEGKVEIRTARDLMPHYPR